MSKTKEELNAYHALWRKNNPEKVIEIYKKYYLSNKDKAKEYYLKNKESITEKARLRALNKHTLRLLNSAKQSANKKGLQFNLDLSDIVIPEYCPYLGVLITNELGKGRVWSNASIDRIDPTIGYIKGNIEVISMKANTMKQNASHEELLTFARSILTKYAG